MVFKLIRVDVESPSKIELQVGKHVIGRGKFLNIDDNDKRVSRNHAELEVTDDSVILKALHQNPCFYTKANTVDTEILHQNNVYSLSNGDKFGLIPDHFWYEVIKCSEATQSFGGINENVNGFEKNSRNGYIAEEKSKEEEREESKKSNGTCEQNTDDEAIDFHMSEADNSNRSASPSLLNQNESSDPQTDNTQAYDPAPSTPSKRGHDNNDGGPSDVKKIKTEPLGDQDVKPGPSNNQAAVDNDVDQKPVIAALASPQHRPPGRERCLYGANCYRRNPQHKAQFSHPCDVDWGPGERGACPYGAACRKPDPRHWQAHAHPHGAHPPNPARASGQKNNRGASNNTRSKKKRQRNSSESDEDSEDSQVTDLIVTGKRVRKTVNRESWIDDTDSDQDPYKTDDSDEWQPSGDVTSSGGFTQ